MTEAEKVICRLYLEDMDKNHTCNEYKLLMELLDKEPCEDVISRQDAIAIASDLQIPIEEYQQYNQAINNYCAELIKLPSAEPKIIHCRECKFASGDSRICMKSGYSPIGELDFCAWAERIVYETDT